MSFRSCQCAFTTRPSMTLNERGPPARPPWRRGYGEYCFRASCELVGPSGLEGKVIGYDRYMSIAADVENACSVQSRDHPGSACSVASVSLLSEYRKECSGEVYFVVDGTSRKLL